MADPKVKWEDIVAGSAAHGVLAKRLYAVMTEPADGLAAVMENREEHLKYQGKIEQEGIMFAAGPLADDNEEYWTGEGLVIIRADSLEHAREIAAADPMHASGARKFRVRPWLMNEGCVTVRVTYSDGKHEII